MEIVTKMFEVQDFAKKLLFESKTEKEVTNARSLLNIVQEELKMLYIPVPTENV